MIIYQTTRLIKAAAKLTGFTEKSILLRTRDKEVNAVRSAIFQILLDLGHTRNRIAQAFGCDAKTIKWALDHPTAQSRTITRQLLCEEEGLVFRDCSSGTDYGICRSCGKAHGYVIRLSSLKVEI